MELKVKYHYPDMPRLKKIKQGDWIDLYAMKVVNLPAHRFDSKTNSYGIFKNDYIKVDLGVSIQLPLGYEAFIVPRSSTFEKYGLVMVNSIAVIDNAYCGDNDKWHALMYCLKHHAQLPAGVRLCQFKIVKNMPEFDMIDVNRLNNKDRGGIGSTGA